MNTLVSTSIIASYKFYRVHMDQIVTDIQCQKAYRLSSIITLFYPTKDMKARKLHTMSAVVKLPTKFYCQIAMNVRLLV